MNANDFRKRQELLSNLSILAENEKNRMFPNYNWLVVSDALIFLLRRMPIKEGRENK